MRHRTLCDTIDVILEQNEHDINWSYYLSYASSIIRPPESDMSFNDFKKYLASDPKPVKKEKETNNVGLNKKQVDRQISKAERILKGFVPVKEGGAR